MAIPVHVPRINNNDDVVKLVGLAVAVGDRVCRGDVVGQVETDKAIVDIESPADAFVLGALAVIDEMVEVGRVLLWLGETADEPVPQPETAVTSSARTGGGSPTAKAQLLLKRHGLSAGAIPHSGERLGAEDVERFLAAKEGGLPASSQRSRKLHEQVPEVAGEKRDLRSDERGMLHTVAWSRDVAVPGYVELEYDPQPWETYAKAYTERNRLMLSPLLSLMAWRMVQLAVETPALNSTMVGEQRYEYGPVNLGFTVQAGDTLYLTVLRNAANFDEAGFVNALADIQRRASAHKLTADEVSGATVSLSSMARWKVSRHIPVLPPHTALMIAHAASSGGATVLGASYDHRVLNGFQVVNTLRKLSKPGILESAKAL